MALDTHAEEPEIRDLIFLSPRRRAGRGSRIRTCDLEYPKLPRYQTALYPARAMGEKRPCGRRGRDAIASINASQQRQYVLGPPPICPPPPGGERSDEHGAQGCAFAHLASDSQSTALPCRWERGRKALVTGNVSGERSERQPGRRAQCRVSWRCRPPLRARPEPSRPKE